MRNPIQRTVWLFTAAMLAILFTSTQAFASDGKAALELVPSDAMMVVSIDVERFRDSAIYEDLLAMATSEKDVSSFLEKLKTSTGFDYTKDLSTLVMAAPESIMSDDENFFIIAEGKFDEKKIVEFATAEGANLTQTEYSGVAYYEIDKGGLAFLGDFVVVGPKDLVQKVIETHEGKSDSVAKSKVLSKAIDSVKTDGDLWFAMNFNDQMKKELAKEIPSGGDLNTLTGTLDLASGLALGLALSTTNADSAKAIADMLSEQIKVGASDPTVVQLGLADALNNIKVDANDTDVEIALALSETELETIQQMIQGMMGGMIR